MLMVVVDDYVIMLHSTPPASDKLSSQCPFNAPSTALSPSGRTTDHQVVLQVGDGIEAS